MTTNIIMNPANATSAAAHMSERYGFIPTSEIVTTMRQHDWLVTSEQSVRVRKAERIGFQKHLLRFTHRSQMEAQKEHRIETVLLNSHDGSSSLQMWAGVFRLVCSNGMVVSDGTVGSIRLGHHRLQMDKVLTAAHHLLDANERVQSVIADWRQMHINRDDAMHLAEQGIILRWQDAEKAPVNASDVLGTIRRDEDRGGSLWEVFNRVQENIVRRGLVSTRTKPNGKRHKMPRSLTGLDASLRVNKGLWEAANEIALRA